MKTLDSSVALITGASSGLGWNFARTLASAGAKVALVGRRAERLEALADVIGSEGGIATAIAADVSVAESLPGIVQAAEHALGTVDILVNNAGIPDAQLATRMSLELVERVIAINLKAPFILSAEVAKRLIAARRPGRIVNLSSMAAFHYDGSGAALYSTTKAAVGRMTEALAVEWARFHINVNAIAPGYFSSEMTDGMVGRVGDFSGSFPRQRFGAPAQLDSTLLYLCNPMSDCVTGTVIKVDDGQMPR